MTPLTTTNPPELVQEMYQQLFLQVAERHGCAEHLYQSPEGGIRCRMSCVPCKKSEMVQEYHLLSTRLTRCNWLNFIRLLLHKGAIKRKNTTHTTHTLKTLMPRIR